MKTKGWGYTKKGLLSNQVMILTTPLSGHKLESPPKTPSEKTTKS